MGWADADWLNSNWETVRAKVLLVQSQPRTELEHWGDRRSQADQVDGPPQERIARYHGMLVAYPSGI